MRRARSLVGLINPALASAQNREGSRICALVPIELPIGEVVRLEIKLPLGPVNVVAGVQNRNISRHGFEFVQPDIGRETDQESPRPVR